ncbi:UDP-glucose:undecaprenyl-phosphate glucose-1-phosphate transferase [Aequorivita sp. CIP111184]|nr:UDP-glucose:undecaprenyl-phosphate glucose-1-phosphate transferase [Aequorivita sp. CIP111184]
MQVCCGTISSYGQFLRSSKFDELPQLLNILLGQMSFVGPRPDVPGYYDKMEGEERKILELKPGLCSRAALKYYNEEALLAKQKDPLLYNDEIIFPDKVRMNLEYYYNRSFFGDLRIILEVVVWKLLAVRY